MQTNQVWLAKVPYLEKIKNEAVGGSEQAAFLVDVASSMLFAVFAEWEVFGHRQTLHILTRGLALCKKVSPLHTKIRDYLMTPGCTWGNDFMLADTHLQDPPYARALKYVECLTLTREKFLHMVNWHGETCVALQKHLRWYICWTAFQHAFLKVARHRIRQRKGMFDAHAGQGKDMPEDWASMPSASSLPTSRIPSDSVEAADSTEACELLDHEEDGHSEAVSCEACKVEGLPPDVHDDGVHSEVDMASTATMVKPDFFGGASTMSASPFRTGAIGTCQSDARAHSL